MSGHAFVYVISPRDNAGIPVGPCKVGVTKNLDGRLRALQTGNPNKLYVISRIEFPDVKMAYDFEEAMHVSSKLERLSGEWFSRSPVDISISMYICMKAMLEVFVPDESVRQMSMEISGANSMLKEMIAIKGCGPEPDVVL